MSEILPCNAYTKLDDGTTWPSWNQNNLEYALRYGQAGTVDDRRMLLASVVSAYMRLISLPQKRRNRVCSELMTALRREGE